jgi:hypothetical protein
MPRKIEYISPTALQQFYKDREEYYLKYLAVTRPPKIPQTRPMSIGSAFDAYVKTELTKRLLGNGFDFETIFEQQVEPQNRDWAREHGKIVYDYYVSCGALADLMVELSQAGSDPRFELTVEKNVTHTTNLEGVPLLGKPDVYYTTKSGLPVVLDWKVNGYCSVSPTSPKPGYLVCRDDLKRTSHKDCHPHNVEGLMINVATTLEDVDSEWATQLTMYGWTLGQPVGSKFCCGIEQIVKGSKGLRVASHRYRISETFQEALYEKLRYMWTIVKPNIQEDGSVLIGHIFNNLTLEESDARCRTLDDQFKAFSAESPNDKWFQATTRK